MSNSLSVIASLNQGSIPANSPVRLAYLLVQIQPGAMSAETMPVNLNIVVDNSDSMGIIILTEEQINRLRQTGHVTDVTVDGVSAFHFDNMPVEYQHNAPRDHVKRALDDVAQRIKPRDKYSLVVFARDARVLVRNQSGKDTRALDKAVGEMDNLKLGNDTRMATGMQKGIDEVKRGFSREMVNRMIVLTDGFTTDAQQCRALAAQAAQAGISISTMGLGAEFNEDLLISISDSSGGNAYLIHSPDEITNIFEQELAGAQNVILRDLDLKMRLMQGVELRHAYRVKPTIADLGVLPVAERSIDLPLGELNRNGEIALLFELLVPPRAMGTYQLAHLVTEYNQPGAGVSQKDRQDCVIQYTPSPMPVPVNPQVMNMVETISAFRLHTRALEDAARGDVSGATQKLQAAATRLINMGESELAQTALDEAANLQQKGQMSADGTKKLRYDTRRLTQRL